MGRTAKSKRCCHGSNRQIINACGIGASNHQYKTRLHTFGYSTNYTLNNLTKSSLLKYVVATILIAIVLVTLTLLWQRPKVYQVDVDYGTSITSRIESLDEELFECNDFQVPQNARDLDIIPEQIGQQTTIIKLIHLRAFGNGGGNITVEALLSEIDRKGFALLLLKRLYSYTSNIDRPNLYLHHSGRMPLGQFYIQMLSWVSVSSYRI